MEDQVKIICILLYHVYGLDLTNAVISISLHGYMAFNYPVKNGTEVTR